MAQSHPTVAMPSNISHPKGQIRSRLRELVGSGSVGCSEVPIESELTPLTSLFPLVSSPD